MSCVALPVFSLTGINNCLLFSAEFLPPSLLQFPPFILQLPPPILQLPPPILQLPPCAWLHDDSSAAQALELARRDGRAVAHSPQAAAVQLYAVINAQTDVVKSQVVVSSIHISVNHPHLHHTCTAASVIIICIWQS